MRAVCALGIVFLSSAVAATKILVSVIEPKTGVFVEKLKAEDFTVLDDKTPRRVESAELATSPLDIMLLLDTSLVGNTVQPVAADLIAQLQDKDQMAIVSVHSSADLIHEFTSSKDLLRQAVSRVKYGNNPRLIDGLYAAIDGGFDNTVYRKIALLLTTGLEAGGRVSEKDVIRLARKNAVSIYPVYLAGMERHMFQDLARQTGGASFNLQEMRKAGAGKPGPRIFETLRKHYVVTVTGNLSLGDKVRVEVRSQSKLFISALPEN